VAARRPAPATPAVAPRAEVPAAAPDADDAVVVLEIAGPRVLLEGPGLAKQVLPAASLRHQ